MLEPDSRSLLSDLLRPPAGFQLSHAVGTSFTMTLEAALSIPLAFAGAVEVDDEVGILGAVRRAILLRRPLGRVKWRVTAWCFRTVLSSNIVCDLAGRYRVPKLAFVDQPLRAENASCSRTTPDPLTNRLRHIRPLHLCIHRRRVALTIL